MLPFQQSVFQLDFEIFRTIASFIKISSGHYLRNKSWKPECVLSFNMGWWILVFYPEHYLKFTNILPTHVKTQNTFWLP
jgi:hypothetical protein